MSNPRDAGVQASNAEGVALSKVYQVMQELAPSLSDKGIELAYPGGSSLAAIAQAVSGLQPADPQYAQAAVAAGAQWASTSVVSGTNLTVPQFGQAQFVLSRLGINLSQVDFASLDFDNTIQIAYPGGSPGASAAWSVTVTGLPFVSEDPLNAVGATDAQGSVFSGTVTDAATGVPLLETSSILPAGGSSGFTASYSYGSATSAPALTLSDGTGRSETFNAAAMPPPDLPSVLRDAVAASGPSGSLAPLQLADGTVALAPLESSFSAGVSQSLFGYAAGALRVVGAAGAILDVATSVDAAAADLESGQAGAAGQVMAGLVSRLEVGAAGAETGAEIGAFAGPWGAFAGGLAGGLGGVMLGNDASNTLWSSATSAINAIEGAFGLGATAGPAAAPAAPGGLLPGTVPADVAALVDQAVGAAYLGAGGLGSGQSLSQYAQVLQSEVLQNQAAPYVQGPAAGSVTAQADGNGGVTAMLFHTDGTPQLRVNEDPLGGTAVFDYGDSQAAAAGSALSTGLAAAPDAGGAGNAAPPDATPATGGNAGAGPPGDTGAASLPDGGANGTSDLGTTSDVQPGSTAPAAPQGGDGATLDSGPSVSPTLPASPDAALLAPPAGGFDAGGPWDQALAAAAAALYARVGGATPAGYLAALAAQDPTLPSAASVQVAARAEEIWDGGAAAGSPDAIGGFVYDAGTHGWERPAPAPGTGPGASFAATPVADPAQAAALDAEAAYRQAHQDVAGPTAAGLDAAAAAAAALPAAATPLPYQQGLPFGIPIDTATTVNPDGSYQSVSVGQPYAPGAGLTLATEMFTPGGTLSATEAQQLGSPLAVLTTLDSSGSPTGDEVFAAGPDGTTPVLQSACLTNPGGAGGWGSASMSFLGDGSLQSLSLAGADGSSLYYAPAAGGGWSEYATAADGSTTATQAQAGGLWEVSTTNTDGSGGQDMRRGLFLDPDTRQAAMGIQVTPAPGGPASFYPDGAFADPAPQIPAGAPTGLLSEQVLWGAMLPASTNYLAGMA